MKWKPLLVLIVVSTFWSVRVAAHGVKIGYETTQAIKIDAAFDNGDRMSNAQVTVYAPDDPSTPWLQGTTDANGHFFFTPDDSQSGNWTVRVRQASHGNMITIPLETQPTTAEETTENDAQDPVLITQSTSNSFTPLQIVIMSSAVIWGFVGTAFFFSRGKRSTQH